MSDEANLDFKIRANTDGTVSVTVTGAPDDVPSAFADDVWDMVEEAAMAALKAKREALGLADD